MSRLMVSCRACVRQWREETGRKVLGLISSSARDGAMSRWALVTWRHVAAEEVQRQTQLGHGMSRVQRLAMLNKLRSWLRMSVQTASILRRYSTVVARWSRQSLYRALMEWQARLTQAKNSAVYTSLAYVYWVRSMLLQGMAALKISGRYSPSRSQGVVTRYGASLETLHAEHRALQHALVCWVRVHVDHVYRTIELQRRVGKGRARRLEMLFTSTWKKWQRRGREGARVHRAGLVALAQWTTRVRRRGFTTWGHARKGGVAVLLLAALHGFRSSMRHAMVRLRDDALQWAAVKRNMLSLKLLLRKRKFREAMSIWAQSAAGLAQNAISRQVAEDWVNAQTQRAALRMWRAAVERKAQRETLDKLGAAAFSVVHRTSALRLWQKVAVAAAWNARKASGKKRADAFWKARKCNAVLDYLTASAGHARQHRREERARHRWRREGLRSAWILLLQACEEAHTAQRGANIVLSMVAQALMRSCRSALHVWRRFSLTERMLAFSKLRAEAGLLRQQVQRLMVAFSALRCFAHSSRRSRVRQPDPLPRSPFSDSTKMYLNNRGPSRSPHSSRSSSLKSVSSRSSMSSMHSTRSIWPEGMLQGGIRNTRLLTKELLVVGFARWKREAKARVFRRQGSGASRSLSWSVSTTASASQHRGRSTTRHGKKKAAPGAVKGIRHWKSVAAESRLEFAYMALQQYRTTTQLAAWKHWGDYFRGYQHRRSQFISPSVGSAYGGSYNI